MSAPEFRNYDLSAISLSFATIPITGGYGEGAITVERGGPVFGTKVGDDGSIVRYRMADQSHRVTLRLQHGAVGNTILSSIQKADEIATNGAGIAPFTLIDPNSTFSLVTDKAFLEGPPQTVDFAAEPGDREWIFVMPLSERTD